MPVRKTDKSITINSKEWNYWNRNTGAVVLPEQDKKTEVLVPYYSKVGKTTNNV